LDSLGKTGEGEKKEKEVKEQFVSATVDSRDKLKKR